MRRALRGSLARRLAALAWLGPAVGLGAIPVSTVAIVVDAPRTVDVRVEKAEVAGETIELTAPGEVALAVSPGVWWLEADGFWAPPLKIDPLDDADSQLADPLRLPVRLWPAEDVHFDVAFDHGAAVGRPAAEFAGDGSSVPRRGEARCRQRPDATWRCPIPEGAHEVRVAFGGFVPVYADVAADAGHLGTLRFRSGASVTATVVDGARPTAQALPDGTEARLVRLFDGWMGDPRTGRVGNDRVLRSAIGAHGRMQWVGVPVGEYRLVVEAPGRSPAILPRLRVEADNETRIDAPLTLEPLVDLDLGLSPPVDPDGRAWTATLFAATEDFRIERQVASSAVAVDGNVALEDLAAGTYRVVVEDSRGSRWLDETVEVDQDGAYRWFELPGVQVRGRLRAGDEPRAGSVIFGTAQGAIQIRMTADADGRFEGFLPREGEWPVELALGADRWDVQAVDPVDVSARPGRRVAHVDIELPDTTLRGQVLRQGEAVAGASVLVLDPDSGRRRANVLADADGTFVLRGLKEGPIHVMALADGTTSAKVAAELVDGRRMDEVVLRLQELVTVDGALVDDFGLPVSGARLVVRARDARGEVIGNEGTAITGGGGEFSLEVLETAHQVDLLVLGEHHALGLTRVPVGNEWVALTVPSTGGRLRLGLDDGTLPRHPVDLVSGGVRWPLDAWIAASGRLQIGIDGELVIEGLAPGAISVCHGASCQDGVLVAGAELTLNWGHDTLAD